MFNTTTQLEATVQFPLEMADRYVARAGTRDCAGELAALFDAAGDDRADRSRLAGWMADSDLHPARDVVRVYRGEQLVAAAIFRADPFGGPALALVGALPDARELERPLLAWVQTRAGQVCDGFGVAHLDVHVPVTVGQRVAQRQLEAAGYQLFNEQVELRAVFQRRPDVVPKSTDLRIHELRSPRFAGSTTEGPSDLGRSMGVNSVMVPAENRPGAHAEVYLAAIEDEAVVGVCQSEVDEFEHGLARLQQLAVPSTSRQRGVESLLLSTAAKAWWARGVQRLALWVDAADGHVLDAAEGLGWMPTRRNRVYMLRVNRDGVPVAQA